VLGFKEKNMAPFVCWPSVPQRLWSGAEVDLSINEFIQNGRTEKKRKENKLQKSSK